MSLAPLCGRLLCGVLLLVTMPSFAATDVPPARFGIGDAPPALQPLAWIKDKPDQALAPGKVHVVNFFATWCGASRQSMTLMSRVAREHGPELTVTGVNVREAERGTATVEAVSKFVAERPESFAYSVAMDAPQGTPLFQSWMRGADMYAIPTAFIIGRDGRVAWIGIAIDDNASYPFEQALADALRDGADLARSRKLHADTASQIADYLRDREILADMDAANARGDHVATLAAAEAVIAAHPDYRLRTAYTRLEAMLHLDEAAALVFVEQELDALKGGEFEDRVEMIAGSLGAVIARFPQASPRAQDIAMAYLQRGLQAEPDGYAGVIGWLNVAALEHARGRHAQAAAAQEQALRLSEGRPEVTPDMRASMQKKLEAYRAASGSADRKEL
jgi:thiol-disulfide isomerase/thioredoxin